MKKLIYTLPLLLALGACSNEEVVNPGNQPENVIPKADGCYITFTVEADASAVSKAGENTTQDSGDSNEQVAATTKENQLKSADICFLDKNDNILLVIPVSSANFVESGNSSAKDGDDTVHQITVDASDPTVHKIVYKVTDVSSLLPLCVGEDIYMVIAGNKTEANFGYTLEAGSVSDQKNAKNATVTVTYGAGAFLKPFGQTDNEGQIMPLTSYTKTTISAFTAVTGASSSNTSPIIEAFTGEYGTNGKAVEIEKGSNIALERAVARIDFSDRTSAERQSENATLQNRPYCYQLGSSNAILKLTNIKPINVSNSSYVFRQVIKGTTESAYGGSDNNNILLGVENGGNGTYNWVANPDWKSATEFKQASRGFVDLSSAALDPSDLTKTYDSNTTGYYPWVYVAETTVPTRDMMTTSGNGFNLTNTATGIEFQFKVMDKTGETVLTTANIDGATLPDNVVVVEKNSKKYLKISQSDGSNREIELTADGAILTYTGYLKHNNATSAAMEYGVVRNNVYQVKVTKVTDSENWEDAKPLYITLDVQVKKWQKRKNDFAF